MSEAPFNSLATAFVASCREEIEAPKPGNVHIFAEGHGMTVDQFRRSAAIAAQPLCERGAEIGARILGALEATFSSVGANTNLGIILLCAPLAAAADLREANGWDFQVCVKAALAGLTRRDAQSAFKAIVRASPAGLGESGRHDVRRPAETTLLEAMREAASRDRIAYQYATNYSDIFGMGIGVLDAAHKKDWPAPWPVVAVYLTFLAGIFDSHIARKNGLDAAVTVQNAAAAVRDRFMSKADPANSLDELLDFDHRLKASRLNPGTSADLTVATLFADRLNAS